MAKSTVVQIGCLMALVMLVALANCRSPSVVGVLDDAAPCFDGVTTWAGCNAHSDDTIQLTCPANYTTRYCLATNGGDDNLHCCDQNVVTCSAPGTSSCGNTCVNLQNDAANCGGCGSRCATGWNCINGTCQTTCANTICGNGQCVNTDNDPVNCGGCGAACTSGQVCSGGKCLATCQFGETSCSGKCVNTNNDPVNCGSCGHMCPSGQVCTNSICTEQCVSNQTFCSGICVTTAADSNNCGSCGHICPSGQVCSGGTCNIPCPTGQVYCTASAKCVDTATDVANCGSCGHACGGGLYTCTNSTCQCPAGNTVCPDGTCVNTTVDKNNCGLCGNVCPTGSNCGNGGFCS